MYCDAASARPLRNTFGNAGMDGRDDGAGRNTQPDGTTKPAAHPDADGHIDAETCGRRLQLEVDRLEAHHI